MRILFCTLILLFAISCAKADILLFNFENGSGGSNASGFVDTIANTFTLTSYSRTDTNYRIPDTPLVFEAIAAGISVNTPWDVPDSATHADIISALDALDDNMFLVPGNNSDHTWDMPANFGHTAGWGGGVFDRGGLFGSPSVTSGFSTNFNRWAFGGGGFQNITFATVVAVPEPGDMLIIWPVIIAGLFYFWRQS